MRVIARASLVRNCGAPPSWGIRDSGKITPSAAMRASPSPQLAPYPVPFTVAKSMGALPCTRIFFNWTPEKKPIH